VSASTGIWPLNDPGVADFRDPRDVKLVELDEVCRQQQVDDGCFSAFADVPARAVTLTIPRLLRADRLFCIEACVAGRASVPWFPDVGAMLAAGGLDAVVVCSPSGAQAEAARAAIAAGVHVLVEKPLCVDPAEGADLVRRAEVSGLVCGVVSQRRLEPQHLAIRELLVSGRLGRPRLVEGAIHWLRTDAFYQECDWRTEAAHGGGSLFNQGVHTLDLMLWLLGPVRSVQGSIATLGHRIAVEDTTASVLKFEGGEIGTLVTSTALPPGRPAVLSLFTDRGSFELAHDEIVRWDFDGVPKPQAAGGGGSGAADPGAIGIVGHVAQWTDFVAAIRSGAHPAITFRDGYESVRTGAAIYLSARQGREVALSEFALPQPPG
jgi:UDP-N-acetyl-2-amino-2-deoxyglucuronate dehydrogenase